VKRGEIRFDNVSFSYGGERPIIDGLNLTIRPGEKIGLVGRSGAGKSTIVNLMLRFYDVEQGRILIDGQDIAAVTQDSLRANRHGDAGHLAAAPLGTRQPAVRQARCRRCRHDPCRPSGRGA
jgi:ABC-type transport system involved in cytochrome bd biosynthesis fused ATPase/permease subunit